MLTYQKGDLFDHVKDGDVIAHCCNDIGAWGGGFTGVMSRWCGDPETDFHNWAGGEYVTDDPPYQLGETMFSRVITTGDHGSRVECVVANMVGQHGLISSENPHPISYPALEKAMKKVAKAIELLRRGGKPLLRIVAPKFGAGLAGGDWAEIEKLIKEVWHDYEVVIFELD
jgi:O-acetyl-ADP-ribose deacetylase (regulator of RNase III)